MNVLFMICGLFLRAALIAVGVVDACGRVRPGGVMYIRSRGQRISW